MEDIDKKDVVYSWNEVEEVKTSLKELTDDELIEHRETLIGRLNNVLNSLGKYVSDEDVFEII